MDFQKILFIEDIDTYLDYAIKKAKRMAVGDKKEERKVSVVGDYLSECMYKIVKSFPNLDDLSEFHKQLIHNFSDFEKIKHSLGAVYWAGDTILKLKREHMRQFRNEDAYKVRKMFYARVNSVLRRVSSDLDFLKETRMMFRKFPMVKDTFTVCIVGFPNVGKTTLLTKLTPSKPEINSYAFTTKIINMGFIDEIQVLDTPGSLSRPDKMNSIEKQAYLAMKYLADLIVYVYDYTEPYPLEKQDELFKKVKEFNKPVLKYYSKSDLISVPSDGFKSVEELVDYIKNLEKN